MSRLCGYAAAHLGQPTVEGSKAELSTSQRPQKMSSTTRVPKLFGDLLLGPTFQRSHHLPTAPSCVPRLYHRALGDFSKYPRNNHSVLSRPNPSTSERLRPSGGSAQTEGKPVHGGRMQTGQGRRKVCSFNQAVPLHLINFTSLHLCALQAETRVGVVYSWPSLYSEMDTAALL